jgi:hypothetical protein
MEKRGEADYKFTYGFDTKNNELYDRDNIPKS